MRAIVQARFGPPDVLEARQVPRPEPGPGELLVRVRAAGVNPLDWHVVTGLPLLARGSIGMRRPKQLIAGVDLAGVVEAVGSGVSQLQVGDEVFGGGMGAFADYARAKQAELAPKPHSLSFEEAAAVPVAAVTALQALRDHGRVHAGQAVLINGASGGVGLFAVQIARHLGAEVTGVCSAGNVELVRSMGADQVVDYAAQDFAVAGRRYDLILDNAGNHTLRALRRALTSRGTLISNSGSGGGRWLGPMGGIVKLRAAAPFVSQRLVFFLAKLNRADLDQLRDLTDAGALKVAIERTYPLEETAAAVRHLGEGHVRGKLVVTIADR
ncbi:MAG: NAD(P)-dependent alcohol dehydrogenase [Candidatus Dormiibacterota bacterium]